jgi:hypothetical protein
MMDFQPIINRQTPNPPTLEELSPVRQSQKIKFKFGDMEIEGNDTPETQDLINQGMSTKDLLLLKQAQLNEQRLESETQIKLKEIELQANQLKKQSEQDGIVVIYMSFLLLCGCYGLNQITSTVGNFFNQSASTNNSALVRFK